MTTLYQHQDTLLAATADAEANHFWFRGFRQFVTPLLAAAAGGRTGLRLLDCGCGTGRNLTLLETWGIASGIDYTFSGLATARRSGRRHVAQATSASLPFPDATFDIATSFDMLQVVPDPVEAATFGELARVLKPGGALVLNVAAMAMLSGDHALLSEESRRYSRRELREKLSAAGFEVERITHTNATLFPLMLAVRTLQRVRGARAARTDIATPSPAVNGALGALLAVEARVVKHVSLPVGSSILCLARKRATSRPGP
jgi:ubiquinone/menaquinone biosynthesis C-methylase UbiE